MTPATEALLFPYNKGLLDPPAPSSRLLFLNAENPLLLKTAPKESVLVQPRYDKALPLLQAGYRVNDDGQPLHECHTAWILPGKDLEETQYLLARAAVAVKRGGVIVAAAANDAGGKRLEGLFEKLGFSPQSESKNKCRIVYATMDGFDKAQADAWIAAGAEQPVLDGSILSCPGLHGWNKVDEGSALLARLLPQDLSGHVADFGCGWGYLSLQVAAQAGLRRLTLLDVDARAVRLAERNVRQKNPALPVTAIWADLSHPDKTLGPYDAILLNPPFHEGTRTVPALGQAIITTAARALKPLGTLYLVANRHLPYEKLLSSLFGDVEMLADEGGFKVLRCRLK